ncbi:haloacid dehalogenase type II, partial [Mesorhizobium sp. M7A.F.Ca.CA.001.08.2.1]
MSSKKPVAIVFDTFGSVVDWRGSLVAEMKELGGKRGVNGDWAAVADAWRHGYHRMLDEVTTGTRDYGLLDDLHRELLDEAMRDVGVTGFREDDLRDINLGWHRVKAWPDAVAGLTRLKTKYIVGSLSNG